MLPDALTDTSVVQRRIDKQKGLFWKRGTFRAPRDASPGAMRSEAGKKLEQFIKVMSSKGFTLYNKPTIQGPFDAFDLNSLPQLDQYEYRIVAAFTVDKPRPVRIELPSDMVRQEEDQTLELSQDNLSSVIRKTGIFVGDPRRR